jgi:hypothetical protein
MNPSVSLMFDDTVHLDQIAFFLQSAMPLSRFLDDSLETIQTVDRVD